MKVPRPKFEASIFFTFTNNNASKSWPQDQLRRNISYYKFSVKRKVKVRISHIFEYQYSKFKYKINSSIAVKKCTRYEYHNIF